MNPYHYPAQLPPHPHPHTTTATISSGMDEQTPAAQIWPELYHYPYSVVVSDWVEGRSRGVGWVDVHACVRACVRRACVRA